MARTRLINPEFFLHEGLGASSPRARLLFIAMWTQADREGRLRWLPLKIHGETFPHEPEVKVAELAAELVLQGSLLVYSTGGKSYAQVVNFVRWQSPHRNEQGSKIPTPEPEDHDPAASLATLGLSDQRSTKGQPKVAQGETKGRPHTSYQLPVTSDQLLVTSPTPSKDGVSPGRVLRPPPDPPPRKDHLDLPSGSPLIDYLVEEWGDLLGKHSTLRKWATAAEGAYPGIDLLAQAKQARAWELGNPSRKKKSVRPFLTRWWARAQDRGGSSGHASTPNQPSRQAVIDKARALGAKL